MSDSKTTEFQRLAGRFVLFFVLVWLVLLIVAVSGTVQGVSIPAPNWSMVIIPGCAFVPAAYYGIKLQLGSTPPDQVRAIWPKALMYGVAGLVLLFGSAYAIYRMGPS